jgi:hypothetical protein
VIFTHHRKDTPVLEGFFEPRPIYYSGLHCTHQGRLVPSLKVFDFRVVLEWLAFSSKQDVVGMGSLDAGEDFTPGHFLFLDDDSTFDPFLVIVYFQLTLIHKG